MDWWETAQDPYGEGKCMRELAVGSVRHWALIHLSHQGWEKAAVLRFCWGLTVASDL